MSDDAPPPAPVFDDEDDTTTAPPAATTTDAPSVAAPDPKLAEYAAQVTALQRKVDSLESENKGLLSRAISTEQRLADSVMERDRLRDQLKKQQVDNAVAGAVPGGTDASLLELVEQERKNAKKHNELRLTVESNFADLSMQYETLQSEHDDLVAKNSRTEKQVESLLVEVDDLKKRCSTMESDLATMAELKEQLSAEVDSLNQKLDAEKAAHEATKQASLKLHAMMREMEEEMDKVRERENAMKRELEAMRRKAAAWKKQAERCDELEAKNAALTAQLAQANREIAHLKLANKDYMDRIAAMEEAEIKRKQSEITPEMYQFLKDQLEEARLKYQRIHEKERGWLHERDELLVKIKRLTNELRSKNPSALRMMEVEVQNQLLLGMVQGLGIQPPMPGVSTAGSKIQQQIAAGGGARTAPARGTGIKSGVMASIGLPSASSSSSSPEASRMPPRVLPPLETSSSPIVAEERASTPPPPAPAAAGDV